MLPSRIDSPALLEVVVTPTLLTRLTYEVVTMPDLNPQPLPPGRRVRIFVPNSVMFDLKKMNKITGDVLAKLGCGGCHSGRVLDFVTLEDFVVNPETLDVKETTGFLGV